MQQYLFSHSMEQSPNEKVELISENSNKNSLDDRVSQSPIQRFF